MDLRAIAGTLRDLADLFEQGAVDLGVAKKDVEDATIKLGDLQAMGIKLLQAGKKEEVKQILNEFELPSLSSVAKKDYYALQVALSKVIEKHGL